VRRCYRNGCKLNAFQYQVVILKKAIAMKTLTVRLPDDADPAEARWEMARALYEKGSLSLEQAASLAELAPTYFKMKLAGMPTGIIPQGTRFPEQPTDLKRIRKIAKEMDIQESWEELVAQIGK